MSRWFYKYLIFFGLLLLSVLFANTSSAQALNGSPSVYFRMASGSVGSNVECSDESMVELCALFNFLCANSDIEITKVELESYASPEGDKRQNKTLSDKRSQSVKNFLSSHYNLDSSRITTNSVGVAWEKLKELVADSDIKGKDGVISIIDNTPEETWAKINPTDLFATLVDSRVRHLMMYRVGDPYRYMYKYFFPELRSTNVAAIHFRHVRESMNPEMRPETILIKGDDYIENKITAFRLELELAIMEREKKMMQSQMESQLRAAKQAALQQQLQTIGQPWQYSSEEEEAGGTSDGTESSEAGAPLSAEDQTQADLESVYKLMDSPESAASAAEPVIVPTPLFAVKTNLLYDLALTPNLEIEVPIKDRWSIGLQGMYGWWLKRDNSFCWQVQAADLEARYWLGDRTDKRVMSGWFVGAFASAGFYDFQLKSDSGVQGELYVAAGLSAGYSMTLTDNLYLEFAGGLGYVVNDYQKYRVSGGEYLIEKGEPMRFESVIPAKLEVSIGWLFNSKKGVRK